MRPVAPPPSSPTPQASQNVQGPTPFIPDTISNSRRALTRAASSDVEGGRHASYTNSTGYVTATGLINWRRKKRLTAASSGASGDAGKHGPGMGMQGTPARKKKRKTGTRQRIGLSSTPQGAPIAEGDLQSTSSLPLSSLPDPDDSAGGNETTFIVPEMASLDLTPIQVTQETDTSVDVFGVMTFIQPFRPIPLEKTAQSSETSQRFEAHPLFTDVEDLTIPVAFPSSEILSPQLRPTQGDDAETEAARGVMRHSEGRFQVEYVVPLKFSSPSQSQTDSEGESMFTARPKVPWPMRTPVADVSSASYADVSVPIDDASGSPTSRRLTASLMRTSGAVASKFTDSRIGSRVQNRVSTPFHRTMAGQSDHDDDGVEERTSPASERSDARTHQGSTSVPTARPSDVHSGPAYRITKPLSSLELRDHCADGSPYRCKSLDPASCRAFQFDHLSLADEDEDLGDVRYEAQAPLIEDLHGERGNAEASFDDPEPFFDVGHFDPTLSTESPACSPEISGDTPSNVSSRTDWLPPFVRGEIHILDRDMADGTGTTTPVPFLPSSRLGTPFPTPGFSPVSSETTLHLMPVEETRSDASSLTSLSAVTQCTGPRTSKDGVSAEYGIEGTATPDGQELGESGTKWLGAMVLERMGG